LIEEEEEDDDDDENSVVEEPDDEKVIEVFRDSDSETPVFQPKKRGPRPKAKSRLQSILFFFRFFF